MWLLGMPQPFLWAVLTFGLEFIPYLGGAVMVGLLTIVAFTTFDSLGRTLAAPGAYLAISTLQNNVVSPLVYGQRLRLNPVAVRSEEHTSELQSHSDLVCRLLLEKKKKNNKPLHLIKKKKKQK